MALVNYREHELSNRISGYKVQLEYARIRDEERKECLAHINKLTENIETMKQANKDYDLIIENIDKALEINETLRLGILRRRVTENVAEVWPRDNYQVSYEVEKYAKDRVVTMMCEQDGRNDPVKMQSGHLFRQVASFSTSTEIQMLLGCKTIFVDEALNSGDEESMEDLGVIISRLNQMGVQVIMIEHKHEIYNNLPRTQYNLYRDTNTNKVEVNKIVYGKLPEDKE